MTLAASRADAAHGAFVLLDDCEATESHRRSRLYTGWHSRLVCEDAAALDGWQGQLHAALRQGLHAVLLADYEWGLQLQNLPHPAEQGAAPRLRVELFRERTCWSAKEADAWLARRCDGDAPAGLLGWQATVDETRFTDHIARIHAAIERGDTYQINYTFAFEGLAHGDPVAIYRRLRERQPAQYGALMRLPPPAPGGRDEWILSLSPELFLRVQGRHVTARPMKGTVAADVDDGRTQAAADWLRSDPKNRAENVMIVDLLRNDLGRIARTGSVAVRDLFAVQRNGRVLGMTSTVEAELQPGLGIAGVLRSSFPCGSITGAPKRKTMELIAQLESGHRRGIYTGAIGWVDLHDGAQPGPELDYCLSVPIRTVFLQEAEDANAPHRVRLPVGAGIVWDSRAEQEWQECHLKARFAMQGMSGFELFETMRLDADAALPALWPRHVARLRASARALGFAHDATAWQAQIEAYIATQARGGARPDWRLRMALGDDGTLHVTHGVLNPLADGPPVALILSEQLCATPAWLRRHKTTLRSGYDQAMHAAEAVGAFDCLFFNGQGRLTEGARTNVLVRMDDGPDAPWLTPPIGDGLLPGVMRGVLLDDPAWNVREQPITRTQLLAAREIVVCNALRGVLPARLHPAAPL